MQASEKTTAWRCLDFRRYEKQTLQGFARMQHLPTGLVINDCPVHQKAGRRWINFPARPYEQAGAKQWAPIVEIRGKDALETFQRETLLALNQFLMSPAYRNRRPA